MPDAVDDAWVTKPEQRTEFYAMNGFAYGRSYLGIIPVFRVERIRETIGPGESKFDGPMEGQLITSRDGLSWSRMQEREPVIPRGKGFDQSIMNVAMLPIIVGDEIWEYYTAINTTHGGTIPPKRISIGLAKWRLDGFVSLDADATQGVVETVILSARDQDEQHAALEVNAKADGGHVVVEVIDETGYVIPGYSADDFGPIVTDNVRHRAQWRDRKTLPVGQSIRLRFVLRNASLFSYTMMRN